MQFTCAAKLSLCTLENFAQTEIGFIALCLAASLICGNFLARLLIPSRF